MLRSASRRGGPSRARVAARAIHRRILHPALDFVFPTDCFVCGEPLDAWQRQGACSTCWGSFRPLPRPACPRCALPRPASTDILGPAGGLCARCLLDSPTLGTVRAAVVYDERARGFLLRAKLGGYPELLRPLGEMLAADIRAAGLDADRPTLVPVPSHPWADLRRGFSPARELARVVAARLGLPWRRSVLRRHWFPWGTAKRLARGKRRSLVQTAFRARNGRTPARVLLVDDVMTTGSTLEACSRALRQAGAGRIVCVVAGRTPSPTWQGS